MAVREEVGEVETSRVHPLTQSHLLYVRPYDWVSKTFGGTCVTLLFRPQGRRCDRPSYLRYSSLHSGSSSLEDRDLGDPRSATDIHGRRYEGHVPSFTRGRTKWVALNPKTDPPTCISVPYGLW